MGSNFYEEYLRDKPSNSIWETLSSVHPEWSAEERSWMMGQLTSAGITNDQYKQGWEAYDAMIWNQGGTWEDYQDAKAQAASSVVTKPPQLEGDWWVTRDNAGNIVDTQYAGASSSTGPAVRTETRNGLVYLYDAAGNIVGTESDPSYISPAQSQANANAAQRLAQDRAQFDAQLAYQQAANSWTKYIDESGVWQKNQLGQVQYLGEVPRGEVQNMPSTWSGWGTQWSQSDQYNPTTQRMDTVYNKTPMTWEAVNAQGQWANLPSNWYNVALNNRTLPNAEQQYVTSVPDVVGDLVHARQGYDQRYDLQGGQAATGVTPGGWYDTAQNSNAWQQGYPASMGGTGTGESGGYVTQIPSYQQYTGWDDATLQDLSGWLNSGMSGYRTEKSFYDKMNRRRAPSRYQGVYYR